MVSLYQDEDPASRSFVKCRWRWSAVVCLARRGDPSDSYARSFLGGDPMVAGVGASPFERGLSLTAVDRHLDAGVAYKRQLTVVPNNADAY